MADKRLLDNTTFKYVVLFLFVGLLFISYMNKRKQSNLKEACTLPFYNVQPSEVDDGTYRGKTYTSFQHVQLDVTVQNHQITDIQIVENRGQYGQKVEPIFAEMIEANSPVVTAVKGEEIASLIMVSCVDDALHNGKEHSNESQLSTEN